MNLTIVLPVRQPKYESAAMFAVSVDGFALLGVFVEDVVLLKSLELLQEASSLPHLLADVHGILESLVPGKLGY